MCGIFGYVGERDPLTVCLEGLSQLEYRGYDSTGIAGISEGVIAVQKKAGKLSQLKRTLSLPRLELAIAHTRWATHGQVNDVNAHPHLDETGAIALIHNGIIENYAKLKQAMIQDGISFKSETDSEVIVNLVAKHYQGDLTYALHKSLSFIQGSFAFLVIHRDHPNEILAVARECPLSIGVDTEKTETVISSDPNAFQGSHFDIIFLRGDEIARVTKGKIEVFDSLLRLVPKKTERLSIDSKPSSKDGYDHYMIKEIHEQPETIQKALIGRFDPEVHFDELKIPPSFFSSVKNLWILGCGTSWHAGSLGAMALEDLARIPAAAEIASEARYRNALLSPETLVLAISQSGETADTLAALREAKKSGCKVIGICNVKNSTLSREADGNIFLKAGPEVSVCSTKAFTSQLAVLLLFTLFLGRQKETLTQEKARFIVDELEKLPSLIQRVLDQSGEIEKLAEKYAQYDDFFFMGRRYMYPTCQEAALKLKEISYVNANGYPAGELKHGPIALLNPHFPVIAFCANEKTKEKIGSNVAEVKARGAPVFAIAPYSFREIKHIADDVILIPDTLDELAAFPSTVVGQLFAYYFAKVRGCDIDQPRNLAKSVTVE